VRAEKFRCGQRNHSAGGEIKCGQSNHSAGGEIKCGQSNHSAGGEIIVRVGRISMRVERHNAGGVELPLPVRIEGLKMTAHF